MRLLRRGSGGALSFVTANEQTYDTPYAILSHTWSGAEVTYQDVAEGSSSNLKKPDYSKINFALNQAEKEHLEYVWIDTCCINKWDFTELGKSINLMYQWYANATICYVYLADITSDGPVGFTSSRWFTRGWTLQELVAPRTVDFYDRNGTMLGSKDKLSPLLASATGIPERILRGAPLYHATIAERFRWATNRDTLEPEDKTYCLIGLLDITMVLQYGIGVEAAHERLLDEVKKTHGDRVMKEIIAAGRHDVVRLKEVLQFSDMNARRSAIDFVLVGTGTWLLQHRAYKTWTADSKDNSGFLWIKGHPGAGKSTLIKYIDSETRRRSSSTDIQIAFYFSARGKELEKSTVGMYRSLLHQLLEQRPALESCVADEYVNQQVSSSLHLLKELFKILVAGCQESRIRCFIDALDECDVAEVQDMVVFFRDIAQARRREGHRFDVCFASRYYPALTIKDSINLRLERQKQHKRDLKAYVFNRLDVDHLADGDSIRQQIISRTNGIFMWAVLAVRSLNQEIADGSIRNIQQVVESLPTELDGLYRAIITGRDGKNLHRFRICIQLVVFSMRPLTGREFYDAIPHSPSDRGFHHSTIKAEAEPTVEVMERFVSSASRGLAEWSGTASSVKALDRVQVIHESVREFFLRHRGLEDLFPQAPLHPVAWCHDCIKTMCIQYLSSIQAARSRLPVEDKNNKTDNVLPLLDYATAFVVHHAEAAAAALDQTDFVICFDNDLLKQRLDFSLDFTPDEAVEDVDVRAVHIFASLGTVKLMSTIARLGFDLNLPVANHLPVDIAIRKRNWTVVHQLMVYNAKLDNVLIELENLYNKHGPNFCDINEVDQVVWCPLDSRTIEPYCKVLAPQSVLLQRQRSWLGGFMQMFLAYGGDINIRGTSGGTALALILRSHYNREAKMDLDERVSDMVQYLLDNRASIDFTDRNNRTALHEACWNSDVPIGAIEILLQHGSSVDAATTEGHTSLMYACATVRYPLVKLLLQHGASVNLADCSGWTALCWAVEETHYDCTAEPSSTGCSLADIMMLLVNNMADTKVLYSGVWTIETRVRRRLDSCGTRMLDVLSSRRTGRATSVSISKRDLNYRDIDEASSPVPAGPS